MFLRLKCFVLLLLCGLLAFGPASGETVYFGSASFDSEAEVIDLGSEKVTGWSAFLRFLGQFPNLKRVDMYATKITEANVNRLLKAFPDVEFGWNLQMMYYHFIRTDATAYSTLHGKHPKHKSQEFALLKYCHDLLALDLGHNNLTDISFLDAMPRLRVLILADNRRLKNIEKIGELKDLEYLELFTCAITDISPLTKLEHLTDLNIGNNPVKDWTPLLEMKQLKRLWLTNLKDHMSAKELSALKQMLAEGLPDTRIEYGGDPSENGWREDPHYDVIYEMFHTGTYIPFAESPPADGGEAPSPAGEDAAPVTGEDVPDAERLFRVTETEP